jgi:hypothetical protein
MHFNRSHMTNSLTFTPQSVLPGDQECLDDWLHQFTADKAADMIDSILHPPPDPSRSPEWKAKKQLLNEARQVLAVWKSTGDCWRDFSYESTWNEQVHGPLLACALAPFQKQFRRVNV